MSTTASSAADHQAPEYRALHTGAILAFVLGVASVFTLATGWSTLEACLMTTPIPILGILLSLRAWRKIRSESELYSGERLALAGGVLSLFFLVTGTAWATTVYLTEVPEGYQRISFSEMKPDPTEELAGVIVPPDIKAMEEQQVFIKGYIRPDSITSRTGIKEFLLVRDNNQCCFGDMSTVKYFDQVWVRLQGRLNVDYSTGIFRIGGKLFIQEKFYDFGDGSPVFALEADYAK